MSYKHGGRSAPAQRIAVRVFAANAADFEDSSALVAYSFDFSDDTARRAFAARCPDAWRAGQFVLTFEE